MADEGVDRETASRWFGETLVFLDRSGRQRGAGDRQPPDAQVDFDGGGNSGGSSCGSSCGGSSWLRGVWFLMTHYEP